VVRLRVVLVAALVVGLAVVTHSGGRIEDGANKVTGFVLGVSKFPANVQEFISPSIRQISGRKLLSSYPPIKRTSLLLLIDTILP